jgi:hypothetical protein
MLTALWIILFKFFYILEVIMADAISANSVPASSRPVGVDGNNGNTEKDTQKAFAKKKADEGVARWTDSKATAELDKKGGWNAVPEAERLDAHKAFDNVSTPELRAMIHDEGTLANRAAREGRNEDAVGHIKDRDMAQLELARREYLTRDVPPQGGVGNIADNPGALAKETANDKRREKAKLIHEGKYDFHDKKL